MTIPTLWFASLGVLVYIYVGYPLLIATLGKLRGRSIARGAFEPKVSILIAAYNEERHIEATVKNKLELAYPREKCEIIVISDGSSDRTDEIVSHFAAEGVILLRQETRAGKTAALNRGVAAARGEILVFSDANSWYEREALHCLVENFFDPTVGYVTGKMIYVDEGGSMVGDGCSAYMRYENFLREMETKVGSIVGVDGGIDAVRRELYSPMAPDDLPDFVLPLMVVEKGFRVIYDPRALLNETSLDSSRDEYRMRVRVSLRSLWVLYKMRRLLDVTRHGLYALQLWSHKGLRYMASLPMVLLFGTSMVLAGKGLVYDALFGAQVIFYFGGALAWILQSRGKQVGLLFVPYYLILVNVAAAHALLLFVRGSRIITWEPRKG